MRHLKVIVVVALTMAIGITLTMKTINQAAEEKPPFLDKNNAFPTTIATMRNTEKNPISLPSKRLSRFLAEDNGKKNPRAADHCRKNPGICKLQGKKYGCCNNKCVDLSSDENNCGACKTKCEYTESCCRGQCVDLSMDKRHCGMCNNRCPKGGVCLYGFCDYA
ncbi:hypothetical protein K2173_023825 [Erythroxylum novogranatense]|uniref:Stigma-specific Stig1 family protein n=1 Tax=Erythroxylum novogranatense TaxID=1862640 RepID=A0AAV8TKV3_9ROSI|nr:hypothetical protein K2173_023825 [Erythroxylum novogranatense]